MRTIKTAICSFGMSGRVFHAPFIHGHPGFELYAVLERTANAAAFAYPGIKTFRSLPELLHDESIELVVVNTPNATHYAYAKLAIGAAKHVVVEKPFTIRTEEGHELIELARSANVKLSVFQNRRWDSDFKTVQQIVKRNVLGNIVEAEIHFDRYNESLSPKLHKETPGPGTGILYDLGPHMIDQAVQLFGRPEAVFADLAIVRPISKVEDYLELILFYPGLRVRLKGSYLIREAVPSYILHGSKGSFLKPRADVQESDLQRGLSPHAAGWGREPESGMGLLHTELDGQIIREYIPSQPGNYFDYYEGIYRSIVLDEPLPVKAEEGLYAVQVIEAAYRSAAKKRIVDMAMS